MWINLLVSVAVTVSVFCGAVMTIVDVDVLVVIEFNVIGDEVMVFT